jgi:hypothetical protein
MIAKGILLVSIVLFPVATPSRKRMVAFLSKPQVQDHGVGREGDESRNQERHGGCGFVASSTVLAIQYALLLPRV